MLVHKLKFKGVRVQIPIYDKYSGKWHRWYKSGNKEASSDIINSLVHGKSIGWFENGNLKFVCEFIDGKANGSSEFWHLNGVKSCAWIYKNDNIISSIYWNVDGNILLKEYYGSKEKLQKRELFEKGKLVKTEVVE